MPDQKQSIFFGALVSALLSTSYLGLINCFCCAGVVIGALVTVWHYTKSNRLTIEPGRGAVMGLLAAVLGGVLSLLLNYALMQAGLGGSEVIMESLINTFGDSMTQDQIAQLEEQFEAQQGVGFGAYLLSGLFSIAVYALFGAVGGAIGASIFKKGGAETAGDEW